MTQEQKAKAYDEALKVLHKYDGANIMFSQSLKEEMFPELKESEDERTWIINYLSNRKLNSSIIAEKENLKKAIAWLEKQCEQKLIDKIQLGKMYKCIASPRYSTFVKGLRYVPQDKFLCSLMNFCSDCFEPIEDGEQKPTDKVEPKFHEGEWVVTDKNNVVQIKAIENGKYVLENTMRFSVDYVDKCWRKWTIQDAKDGDVLADDYGIYIFDRFDEEDEKCFLCMGAYQYSQKVYENKHMLCSVEVHPATKEQRDLLFQKMKEAGYEWDDMKKELKKIEQKPIIEMKSPEESLGISSEEYNKIVDECIYGEQKPVDKVEPKFKKGDVVRRKDGDGLEWTVENVHKDGNYTIVNSDRDDFVYLDDNWEIVEQKPAWSEEDETVLNNLIYALANDRIGNSRDEYVNWLKSLKCRIQPQPKQEWSEEDESMLQNILECLKNGWRKLPTDILKYESWLKSLRPQNTWKPSDEQMNALRVAIGDEQGSDCCGALRDLLKDLKSL